LLGIVPADQLRERMRLGVGNVEAALDLHRREVLSEMFAKTRLTMLAEAIVAIKVIDHIAIDAPLDAAFCPCLENRAPVGIIEAGGIFAHIADRVLLRRHDGTIGITGEQVERIGDPARTKLLLIPMVSVELEEAARSVFAIRFSHQERDIEMTDDFGAALVNLRIAFREPMAAFVESLHREVGWIALVLRCVSKAVEMAAVEADLADFGAGILDELQIVRVAILGPVSDHARELRARPKVPIDERVRFEPNVRRKIVPCIRVSRFQVRTLFEEPINRIGGRDAIAHAVRLEIIVPQRRVNENGARCEGAQNLREIERHVRGARLVLAQDPRHVPLVAPAAKVAFEIFAKRVESTARDDDLDARLKGGNKKRIVST
jgi:hypothetical protein